MREPGRAQVAWPAAPAAQREATLDAAAYHQRSKHQLHRYAAGPETLDWDAQPEAFRRYAGAPLTPLPLPADGLLAEGAPSWADLFVPGAVPPRPADLHALGLLFELSFALSAWKQQGPDRWAVRCTPSSGNLHPTEAYLLARGLPGLPDGLHHYAPREHALELRAAFAPPRALAAPALYVGLSSIHWREAWKYGERAFRYCQLDLGHALGALAYAAAVLGWQARVMTDIGHDRLAALLGLDRDIDFAGGAEREAPELLVALGPTGGVGITPPPPDWFDGARWQGRANRLDAHPMYRWPVIDAVAAATRPRVGLQPVALDGPPTPPTAPAPTPPVSPVPTPRPSTAPAVALIRRRRSAQRFERRAVMPAAAFARLLEALVAEGLPHEVLPGRPRVHALLFAHRVEGLPTGAYLLPRSAAGAQRLRAALPESLAWEPVPGLPAALYKLAENPALPGTLRTINCHQALGSDAMLALALLGEFSPEVELAGEHYRGLLQQAGLLGQVLYLEAEACGLAGTGIGCFFDDALHQLVGLQGRSVQSLYHFTIGQALPDPRIATTPPYARRPGAEDPR